MAPASLPPRHEVDTAAWLGSGAAFAAVGPVERIDTHAASIFLHGDRAWKIKRSVDLGYLDFSTPDRRKAALEAELRLNRRTAPDLYIAVHPIHYGHNGALMLDGKGVAIDWVLEMRRFPDDALLSHALANGAVDDRTLSDLADALVTFHRKAVIADVPSGSARLRAVVDGNAKAMARFPELLPPERVSNLNNILYAAVDKHTLLLDVRRREGKVRLCHGDLHLANIVLVDGKLVPFDCLEFDDDLATSDILYDLSFLLMDLCEQGQYHAASIVFNRYFDRSAFDEAAVGLMPLFMAVRASVRAHVYAAQARLPANASDAAKRSLRYLTFAEHMMAPRAPRLVAIGGLSGTGKSTLARALGGDVGRAPGARILRSDVLRKRLAGVAPEVRLRNSSYTAEASKPVYAELGRLAVQALVSGQAVIADAMFAQPGEREAIAEVAHIAGVAFDGLWLRVEAQERLKRIEDRPPDASDADIAVARAQANKEAIVPDGWAYLDAGGDFSLLNATAATILNLAIRRPLS